MNMYRDAAMSSVRIQIHLPLATSCLRLLQSEVHRVTESKVAELPSEPLPMNSKSAFEALGCSTSSEVVSNSVVTVTFAVDRSLNQQQRNNDRTLMPSISCSGVREGLKNWNLPDEGDFMCCLFFDVTGGSDNIWIGLVAPECE